MAVSANLAKIWKLEPLLLSSLKAFPFPFWLLVDNNYIYIVPQHQPPTPPRKKVIPQKPLLLLTTYGTQP